MTTSRNDLVRAWCEEHGLRFKPWEVHPADVSPGPSPWPANTAGGTSWPKAQALRRKIMAELVGEA
jgi:hypothetical protein